MPKAQQLSTEIDPVRLLFILLCISLLLSGCIYSHTVQPLTTDFISTPAGDGLSSGDIKTVTFYVSIEWDENGIGTIAQKHGINEIYYADIETTRVLWYWRKQRVRVYGL
jgi:hypothetical protein